MAIESAGSDLVFDIVFQSVELSQSAMAPKLIQSNGNGMFPFPNLRERQMAAWGRGRRISTWMIQIGESFFRRCRTSDLVDVDGRRVFRNKRREERSYDGPDDLKC